VIFDSVWLLRRQNFLPGCDPPLFPNFLGFELHAFWFPPLFPLSFLRGSPICLLSAHHTVRMITYFRPPRAWFPCAGPTGFFGLCGWDSKTPTRDQEYVLHLSQDRPPMEFLSLTLLVFSIASRVPTVACLVPLHAPPTPEGLSNTYFSRCICF